MVSKLMKYMCDKIQTVLDSLTGTRYRHRNGASAVCLNSASIPVAVSVACLSLTNVGSNNITS